MVATRRNNSTAGEGAGGEDGENKDSSVDKENENRAGLSESIAVVCRVREES